MSFLMRPLQILRGTSRLMLRRWTTKTITPWYLGVTALTTSLVLGGLITPIGGLMTWWCLALLLEAGVQVAGTKTDEQPIGFASSDMVPTESSKCGSQPAVGPFLSKTCARDALLARLKHEQYATHPCDQPHWNLEYRKGWNDCANHTVRWLNADRC